MCESVSHSPGSLSRRTDLHQRALDLTVRAGALGEPAPADGVDLVHEDDAGLVVARIAEHLAHHARRLADVLVHDGGGDHLEEVGLERRSDRAGEQRLARPGRAVEEHAFRGLDADALEELRAEEGKLDDLRRREASVPGVGVGRGRVRRNGRATRTSRSSRTCSPRPPMPAKVAPPGSSRLILYTIGSTSRGRMRMMVRVVMSRLTRVPALSLCAGRAGR